MQKSCSVLVSFSQEEWFIGLCLVFISLLVAFLEYLPLYSLQVSLCIQDISSCTYEVSHKYQLETGDTISCWLTIHKHMALLLEMNIQRIFHGAAVLQIGREISYLQETSLYPLLGPTFSHTWQYEIIWWGLTWYHE